MTTLTATQLRNARKRRAQKKNTTQQPTSTNGGTNIASKRHVDNGSDSKTSAITSNKRRRNTSTILDSTNNAKCMMASSTFNRKRILSDPSQMYSDSPLRAPIVLRAKQFFHDLFQNYDTNGINNNTNYNHTRSTLSEATSCKEFTVYVGPAYGWRTVVKLPVRYNSYYSPTATHETNHVALNQRNKKKKLKLHTNDSSHQLQQDPLITIGLFAPGSHHIVPIVVDVNDDDTATSNTNGHGSTCLCQTHHPVINHAIIHIQAVARSLQQQSQQPQLETTKTTTNADNSSIRNVTDAPFLTAFSEQTGVGYLRHIAISIQRHTNRIQLVLVWNSAPPPPPSSLSRSSLTRDDNVNNITTKEQQNDGTDDIGQVVLQQFVQALLITNNTTTTEHKCIEFHSIWVHYNNTWKHANAIFNHEGEWQLLYHYKSNACEGNNGITVTRDIDSVDHHCPMKGVTEYLSTGNGATNHDESTECSPLPRIPLHFPPQVFRQGNITAFTVIVQSIRTFIIDQFCTNTLPHINSLRPSCLELYGGVGTIGLHIADLCSKFVCSDENPYNVQCFRASAEVVLQSIKKGKQKTSTNTNVDLLSMPSIRYESASASVMVLDRNEHMNDIDIIIVDPPRKGMDTDVCYALTSTLSNPHGVKKKSSSTKTTSQQESTLDRNNVHDPRQQVLIYVSCGFDAFVRDYQILTQSTNSRTTSYQRTKSKTKSNHDKICTPWNLVQAEGHVLFPGSDAIETLAIFTRTKYPISYGNKMKSCYRGVVIM
jgi:tRNA/tmRNA/rRNA uracil-C5-methylase (TrmA/RlmC/RlmD family)